MSYFKMYYSFILFQREYRIKRAESPARTKQRAGSPACHQERRDPVPAHRKLQIHEAEQKHRRPGSKEPQTEKPDERKERNSNSSLAKLFGPLLPVTSVPRQGAPSRTAMPVHTLLWRGQGAEGAAEPNAGAGERKCCELQNTERTPA